jgi:flavorubredoxin
VGVNEIIHKLRYGNTNTFLIKGNTDNLLFDTNYAGTIQAFYKEIKKHKINLSDITYLLASHYHPDHIGLASKLMKQGVKLLLLDTQYPNIHFSDYIFNREKS